MDSQLCQLSKKSFLKGLMWQKFPSSSEPKGAVGGILLTFFFHHSKGFMFLHVSGAGSCEYRMTSSICCCKRIGDKRFSATVIGIYAFLAAESPSSLVSVTASASGIRKYRFRVFIRVPVIGY